MSRRRITLCVGLGLSISLTHLGSAQADMKAYEDCYKRIEPKLAKNKASVIYNLATFNIGGALLGEYKQSKLSKRIQRECNPLLTPAEAAELGRVTIEQLRVDRGDGFPR